MSRVSRAVGVSRVHAPLGTFTDVSPAAGRPDLPTPPVAHAVSAGRGGAPAEAWTRAAEARAGERTRG